MSMMTWTVRIAVFCLLLACAPLSLEAREIDQTMMQKQLNGYLNALTESHPHLDFSASSAVYPASFEAVSYTHLRAHET